jgi:hypothetical protein
VTKTLTVAAYAILGSILTWSRLAGLDNGGYCCDEIRTVADYVRAGPATILTGPYTPNNHELYSLLGWVTSSVFGESEVALRLGAAIPFIAGVVVVTAWLHVRVGPLPAVLFLAFTTFSPLLLDITRLARGYGLAFLAMSVMTVAALEAERSPRTLTIVAFWAAGLVGTWTLPHFAVAFFVTGAVLLRRPELRRRCLIGGALSLLAVAAWYAPHFDDIATSSSQEYGRPIPTAWLVTAPFDQIVLPAFTSLDENLVRPSVATLVGAVAIAIVVASSPLLRRREPALILCAGTLVTLAVFWISGTQVVPRFFSYLLVPLLVLLATGCASILERLLSKPARARTPVVVALLGLLAVTSLPLLTSIPRSRRDSLREAATVIRERAPTAPVSAYMPYPADLSFHLLRAVAGVRRPAETSAVCDEEVTTVLVAQPWFWPEASAPACAERAGAHHYRFGQFARGEETDVWIIPPAQS